MMKNHPLIVHCIRHGESLANAGYATSDPASIPLTDLGHTQALAVRENLRHLSPSLIICSPYFRAQQTAAPAKEIFSSIPVETWPIHESGFLALKRRRVATTAEQRAPLDQAFWNKADPHFVDGCGAESFAEFMARVQKALASFERLHQKQHRCVIAFGHSRFFQAMRWVIRENPEITPAAMKRFQDVFRMDQLPNCTHFTAAYNGRAWALGQETPRAMTAVTCLAA